MDYEANCPLLSSVATVRKLFLPSPESLQTHAVWAGVSAPDCSFSGRWLSRVHLSLQAHRQGRGWGTQAPLLPLLFADPKPAHRTFGLERFSWQLPQ